MSASVSVIVPCFNAAKTISLCLESVSKQTYRSVETIVVDDGSTDATADIARRHGCTVIRLPRNVGAAGARNRGIEASRGGTLFFLDADVALAPDAVANAVRILQEHPSYGAVWGIYGDRPLVDDGVVERVQVLHAHYRQLRKLGPARTGHLASGAVPRRVVDEVGGFDERRGNLNEDIEFSLRIAERFPMIRTAEVVGFHDDDDLMSSVIRKCFTRAVRLVPLALAKRTAGVGREATYRPQEVAAAFLATVSVPLALLSAALLLVPVAFLAWFVAADRRRLQFVRANAGWRMVLAGVALNYACSLTISIAALGGALRYVLDPRFRHRWTPDRQPRTVTR